MQIRRPAFILFLVLLFPLTAILHAQSEAEIRAKFLRRFHTFKGTILPYRLFIPEAYDGSRSYPMVLALHGAGERGYDNELHIKFHRLATCWADTINQRRHPCFVLAPQCPTNQRWVDSDWALGYYRVDEIALSNELTAVINLLDSLQREFSIDASRLYVTGLSMGGYGTWDLIARFPERFAAAVPMSGGGDSTKIEAIRSLPLWIVHGEKDPTVPVAGSRQMVTALENRGETALFTNYNFKTGSNDVLGDSTLAQRLLSGARLVYTEIKNGGHVIWEPAYNNTLLIDWIFAQVKATPSGIQQIESNQQVREFVLEQNYPNPFNGTTRIRFHMPEAAHITLVLYDVLGREVARILEADLPGGTCEQAYDAPGLSSGIYYLHLTAGSFSQTRKMLLMQ